VEVLPTNWQQSSRANLPTTTHLREPSFGWVVFLPLVPMRKPISDRDSYKSPPTLLRNYPDRAQPPLDKRRPSRYRKLGGTQPKSMLAFRV
jgi:hypothetical protein